MSITAVSSKQALIDLVNHDNSTTLTLDNTGVGAPGAPDGNNKTAVVLTGQDNLTGTVTVSYTRLAATLPLPAGTAYQYNDPSATSSTVISTVNSAVLSALHLPVEAGSYTATATALSSSDPDSNSGQYNWKVVLDFASHYILSGSATVLVNSAHANLADIVTTTNLSGFNASDIQ